MKWPVKSMLVVGMIVAFLFGVLVSQAGAADPMQKVSRGFVNIVTAPFEIPVGMVKWSKDHNPFVGLVIGPVAGAVNCVTRMTAGVVEIITSPVPPYDQPLYERDLGETIWE